VDIWPAVWGTDDICPEVTAHCIRQKITPQMLILLSGLKALREFD